MTMPPNTVPPAPRILIVDDETPIRRFLKVHLRRSGFDTIEAERGREGIERAATLAPDAVVLDLGLPDMDGKAVIAAIRAWSQVPILILSVRDGEAEKIAALDAGADDYVTKPFATGELMARLRALLRKRPSGKAERAEIEMGGLALNLAARMVSVDGEEVKLTARSSTFWRCSPPCRAAGEPSPAVGGGLGQGPSRRHPLPAHRHWPYP